jgi:hypothetical protein
MPFPRRELSELGVEERAGINATFGQTFKSEEELSKGPCLGGRDKLQILPKFWARRQRINPYVCTSSSRPK